MQRVLRPLAFSDLFDEIFDIYKKNVTLLVGTVAVIYIPLQLINYFVLMSSIRSFAMGMPTKYTPGSPPPDPTILFRGLIPFLGKAVLLTLLAVPPNLLMTGAITWAISACYLGERPTILQSYKAVLPRLVPLILTSIITWIIYVVAAVFCILPLIPAAILLAFVSQVIVLEGKSLISAIERSVNLAKYDWGKVFGVMALAVVLIWLCNAVVSAPFSIIQALSHGNPTSMVVPSIQVVVESIINALVMPLYTLALVLLYYDIRVRKEGFDLQLLAENMSQNAPTHG